VDVALVRPERASRVVLRHGTIIVCGGGCYGGYYVRQLARAVQGGALAVERVLVLDRDPTAPVARLVTALAAGDDDAAMAALWRQRRAHERPDAPPDRDDPVLARDLAAVRALPLVVLGGDWAHTVPAALDRAADAPAAHAADALVPSPLMPHLVADWLAARLARHARRQVARAPLPAPPPTPWQRAAADGSAHYASHATWMCPINCVEPARCPETRATRHWSMPRDAAAIVEAARALGPPIDVLALVHTTHRTHGVGMFDLAEAAAAARAVDALPADRPARVLVGSVSHCHGAFALLETQP
jgi:hypothetical protein